jgi:hypothetical protein
MPLTDVHSKRYELRLGPFIGQERYHEKLGRVRFQIPQGDLA